MALAAEMLLRESLSQVRVCVLPSRSAHHITCNVLKEDAMVRRDNKRDPLPRWRKTDKSSKNIHFHKVTLEVTIL